MQVLKPASGYRWAEQDELHTRALPSAPAGADARVGTLWPGAQWFEDAVQSWTAQGQPWAYTQHSAVWQGQVVYSRQCLAPEVCLALTRWPQKSGQ